MKKYSFRIEFEDQHDMSAVTDFLLAFQKVFFRRRMFMTQGFGMGKKWIDVTFEKLEEDN